ncbi:hypothetical protein Pcinc_007221 [Petrolisthes cinctipes]|uniref:Uncharacterized protein n=1 Tax=Petrolisthes cinctipes TaxID=88211 RepID=A0AAE1GB98_PETCI|nr:hypothetical protein Pcinc_007221 [Petrolisthes cinctipes]
MLREQDIYKYHQSHVYQSEDSAQCQNEDSLDSFPDNMSDDLTQPANIGKGHSGRGEASCSGGSLKAEC